MIAILVFISSIVFFFIGRYTVIGNKDYSVAKKNISKVVKKKVRAGSVPVVLDSSRKTKEEISILKQWQKALNEAN